MEKFLSIIEDQSSTEIREDKLKFFIFRVKIWGYAKISHADYQNFSLEEKTNLLMLTKQLRQG